jgi:hypothetical protein
VNPHRHFQVGDAGIAGGVNWRIVEGRKAPGDMRLEWYVNERWQPVSMDTIFVAVDVICQNEDFLYPYPARGGQLLIRAIGDARLYGYEYASGWLALQRRNHEQVMS